MLFFPVYVLTPLSVLFVLTDVVFLCYDCEFVFIKGQFQYKRWPTQWSKRVSLWRPLAVLLLRSILVSLKLSLFYLPLPFTNYYCINDNISAFVSLSFTTWRRAQYDYPFYFWIDILDEDWRSGRFEIRCAEVVNRTEPHWRTAPQLTFRIYNCNSMI